MTDTGPTRYDTIGEIAIELCFGPFAARDDLLSLSFLLSTSGFIIARPVQFGQMHLSINNARDWVSSISPRLQRRGMMDVCSPGPLEPKRICSFF